MQDYYEILQVHPKADHEAILAAYERLRQRYDPAKLEGAAEELISLARQRRDEIERAYAVLGDAQRRAAYDAERLLEVQAPPRPEEGVRRPQVAMAAAGSYGATEELLDYRPLPPAQGKERPRDFNAQPILSPASGARHSGRQVQLPLPLWVRSAIGVGTFTFVIILISLTITVWGRGGQTTPNTEQNSPELLATAQSELATPTTEEILSYLDGQVIEARRVTEESPTNVNGWINLGNLLYDSVQIVRERAPDSAAYVELLPRWMEASEAYRKALELQPDNAVVRADLAASLCYYGAGINDQSYVVDGLEYAREAASTGAEDPRVLLNLGVCLIQSKPPQTQEALENWRRAVALAAPGSGVQQAAQQLIAQYGQ